MNKKDEIILSNSINETSVIKNVKYNKSWIEKLFGISFDTSTNFYFYMLTQASHNIIDTTLIPKAMSKKIIQDVGQAQDIYPYMLTKFKKAGIEYHPFITEIFLRTKNELTESLAGYAKDHTAIMDFSERADANRKMITSLGLDDPHYFIQAKNAFIATKQTMPILPTKLGKCPFGHN